MDRMFFYCLYVLYFYNVFYLCTYLPSDLGIHSTLLAYPTCILPVQLGVE